TVQPKSQVQTTFIPSSLETPTKNQEKINTFCPLSQKTTLIAQPKSQVQTTFILILKYQRKTKKKQR
ncbi:hypothetical protein, partial [Mobiluncus mulieris]